MATQYFTGCSLDGFIATSDHNLDWLVTRRIDPAGPMHYEGFLADVGALAMGATTYQWILDHDPAGWSYSQPTWVFTHREFPQPPGDVRFTQAPVAAVHAEMLAAAGGKNVWVVGGGDLAGQFHDAGLLDEVWIQFAPVTLGAGAPVLPRHVELELLDVARNEDFACARYQVHR
ncbi:dihydrofolate reductase family protein [Intrasporangium sp. DVR]|uniref:dihydrofolate reductase family protein n=1 Tax=Intrasporangium sp. DVR TaxID=3127867 RepID=UPI00313A553C